jgi:hypothetical protein
MQRGWNKQVNNDGKNNTLASISQDFIFSTHNIMDGNFIVKHKLNLEETLLKDTSLEALFSSLWEWKLI